jgi:Flp pilus assembly protein TadB
MTEKKKRKGPYLLRWAAEEPKPIKHPYRDTMIVYAGFALVIVGIAAVTGGDLGRAVLIAALFYVAATAWSLLSWRRKLRRRRIAEAQSDLEDLGGAEE